MVRRLLIIVCAAALTPAAVLANGVQDTVRVRDSVDVSVSQLAHLSEDVDAPDQRASLPMPEAAFSWLRPVPAALEELTGGLAPESGRLTGSPLVRGMNAKRVAITFDGIPLGHSGLREGPSLIPLGVIDPSAVATMAVQRGPGIFGPSADGLAGAIDIRSSLDAGVDGPTGSRAMSVLVNQRLSSADRGWSGGVSATGATARVRYRIGGAGSLLGDLRAGSGERSDAVQQPHTSLRESTLHGLIAIDLRPQWSLQGGVLASWRQGQSVVDDLASLRLTPMPDAVSVIDPRHFAFAYLSSRATDLGFVGRFEATVWYNGHREARTFRRSGWERSVFDDDRLAATGVRLSATTVPYRRHTLSVAADAQAEGADSKRWEVRDDRSIWWQRGRFPVGTRSRLLAVSVGDSWQVAETITWKGDLRFMARKIHSAYGPSVFGLSGLVGLVNRWYSGFSWETGLTKRFESGLSLSGSVSRGFRAPGLDDVVANASWRNGRDVPNPDLGSERATQLEIAGRFTGRHNTFGAAIFHTRYGDLIRRDWFEPGPDGLVATGEDLYQFRNLESASVSGGEVGMTTRFSTSWDVDVEVAGRAVMHWWHAAENAVPRYLPPVVARLGTRFSRDLIWVEPYVGFSSRSSAVQYTVAGAVSDESAAWMTLNVRGGARAGERLAFAAAVENIGDVRYHEHGSYIRSPGRNLVLSVSYAF